MQESKGSVERESERFYKAPQFFEVEMEPKLYSRDSHNANLTSSSKRCSATKNDVAFYSKKWKIIFYDAKQKIFKPPTKNKTTRMDFTGPIIYLLTTQ